jgi:hypothetical protein
MNTSLFLGTIDWKRWSPAANEKVVPAGYSLTNVWRLSHRETFTVWPAHKLEPKSAAQNAESIAIILTLPGISQ